MTMKNDYEPSALTLAILDEVRIELGHRRRRWSVAEFARRLDRSQSHVNAILNGKSQLTIDTLVEWCNVLGVDLLALIEAAEAGRASSIRARPSDLPTASQARREALLATERDRALKDLHEGMTSPELPTGKRSKRTKRADGA